MMEKYCWTGFGKGGAKATTILHFFATARGVTAPYPVRCVITVCSADMHRSVVIEGVRLYQPDGVKIEDVFPDMLLSEHYGITIELSGIQQRLDMSTSQCSIEIIQGDTRVVYTVQYEEEQSAFDRLSFEIKNEHLSTRLFELDEQCAVHQLEPTVSTRTSRAKYVCTFATNGNLTGVVQV